MPMLSRAASTAASAGLLLLAAGCGGSPGAAVSAGGGFASGPTATPTATTTTTPAGTGTGPAMPATPATPTATPAKIGHVWVVMLENENFANSFGGTSAPYLSKDLPAMGALLTKYYGTGHVSLDNYISLLSGQGANSQTGADCQVFADFQGTGAQASMTGQALGQGCVYPATVPNLADQLRAASVSWKGYMEDMGNDTGREAATCGHPAVNGQDGTQTATATDSYVSRHNPFVYFHSIIDDTDYCNQHVVNLKALDADLADASKTPTFNFITPGVCHDGHDSTCADGSVGGLVAIDGFMKTLIPKILASPAFQQDGLLVVTFDESNGPQADASGCCGNTSVNSPTPGLAAAADGTSGGGVIGAVAIAPRFIKPGTVSTVPYSHYSLLRTWEDLFGLGYLGYAGQSTQASFGKDVFTAQMPVLPVKK